MANRRWSRWKSYGISGVARHTLDNPGERIERADWEQMTPEVANRLQSQLEQANREKEELRAALGWYEGEASALARYLQGKKITEDGVNVSAVMAVITALSLDAGGRAHRALVSTPQAQREEG